MASDKSRSIQVKEFATARCPEVCALAPLAEEASFLRQLCWSFGPNIFSSSCLEDQALLIPMQNNQMCIRPYTMSAMFTRVRHVQLEGMAAVLAEDPVHALGGPALARHKRRRGGSHKSYRRFLRPTRTLQEARDAHIVTASKPEAGASDPSKEASARPTNRRMRRKHAFSAPAIAEQAAHEQPEAAPQGDTSREGTVAMYGDASKTCSQQRLPAHAWFAKRFVMRPHGQWLLPEHAHGKGHRWRSLRAALARHAVVHDISHHVRFAVTAPDAVAAARMIASMVHRTAASTQLHVVEAVAHVLKASGQMQLACILRNECGVRIGPACIAAAIDPMGISAQITRQAVISVHSSMAEATWQALQHACSTSGVATAGVA
jgi:Ribonucleases P/MRP protein subunit POP1